MFKRSNLIIIILNSLLISAVGQSVADKAVQISVKEMAGVKSTRPVTGGIPLAKGLAPGESQFYMEDEYGQPCPLQYQVLSRWDDESAKWILLDFQANPFEQRYLA